MITEDNRGAIEPPPGKFCVRAPVYDQDVANSSGLQAVGDVDVIFLKSTRGYYACQIAHHEVDRKRKDVFSCTAEIPEFFEVIVACVVTLDYEVEWNHREERDCR